MLLILPENTPSCRYLFLVFGTCPPWSKRLYQECKQMRRQKRSKEACSMVSLFYHRRGLREPASTCIKRHHLFDAAHRAQDDDLTRCDVPTLSLLRSFQPFASILGLIFPRDCSPRMRESVWKGCEKGECCVTRHNSSHSSGRHRQARSVVGIYRIVKRGMTQITTGRRRALHLFPMVVFRQNEEHHTSHLTSSGIIH